MVGSVVRSIFRRSPAAAGAAAPGRTLAVLVGARSMVERGWVQGGWYVLQAPDGRRRFVGAGSLTRRGFGEIVQSCLVGAVVESARWHTAEKGAAGPAIDTLWQELGELSGGRPPVDPRTPTPVLRSRQVGELTTWNDGRSPDPGGRPRAVRRRDRPALGAGRRLRCRGRSEQFGQERSGAGRAVVAHRQVVDRPRELLDERGGDVVGVGLRHSRGNGPPGDDPAGAARAAAARSVGRAGSRGTARRVATSSIVVVSPP